MQAIFDGHRHHTYESESADFSCQQIELKELFSIVTVLVVFFVFN